jgi:MoxR-like ATPase
MEMENQPVGPHPDFKALSEVVTRIREEIARVVVGQHEMVDLIIAAMLADGHVLIEGVPGVAKTLTAKLAARCLDVGFSRIQFTPDLMPSDLLGTSVFNPQTVQFVFRPGPLFSQVVLIDEINRSPAKTQAALFEAMEEKQVTVDGKTHMMEEPFMVIATENPVEHEGTYRLPEAQLDRFLFRIRVPYPSLEEEIRILEYAHQGNTARFAAIVHPVIGAAELLRFRALVETLHIEAPVTEYIVRLVRATREDPAVYLGASPRASVAVLRAARAVAAIAGRDFVTPDDVNRVLAPVLCHRITLTPEKEMEGVTAEQVVEGLVKKTEVPR